MSDCCIETVSGVQFDLLDPTPEMVKLSDIAHSLARQNRFTGHTVGSGYTVAQHSVFTLGGLLEERQDIVMPWSPQGPWLQAHLLPHDAPETYTGDVSGPMKRALRALGSAALDIIEARILAVIRTSLGVPQPTPIEADIVKWIDRRLLATEHRDLRPHTTVGLNAHGDAAPYRMLKVPGVPTWEQACFGPPEPDRWARHYQRAVEMNIETARKAEAPRATP